MFVVTPTDGRLIAGSVSAPDLRVLRETQRSFSSLAAYQSFTPAVTSPTITEVLAAEGVDGAYFSTLNVSPALGRLIQAADEASAARVVVLSDGLWRSRFRGDPRIVGTTVRMAGEVYEVVGVAPPAFAGATGPIPGVGLWVPLATLSQSGMWGRSLLGADSDPNSAARCAACERWVVVFGRLAPGVAIATASAELSTLAANLDRTSPRSMTGGSGLTTARQWRGRSILAITEDDNITHRIGYTLVALVALVLVVACTNLANLVLARGTARQQELAVRCALGAPRWRLVREQCAESLVLACCGGLAAYAVFRTLGVLIDAEVNFPLPMGGRWLLSIHPRLDPPALVLAAGSLVLSLIVFGLEPALQLTRARDLRLEMVAGAGPRRVRRQHMLVRWQVAISTGFFVVATMFVKYSVKEARHESGVQMDRIAVATLNVPTAGWDETRTRRALDAVVEGARGQRSIGQVAVSAGLPFGVRPPIRLRLEPDDAPAAAADRGVDAVAIAASPSIFATLGVPILRGRGFDDRDDAAAPPVLVLSDFTARRLFGESNAIGRQVSLGRSGISGSVATVIGVARDTDVGRLLSEPRPFAYLPFAQRYDRSLTLVARARGDVDEAVRDLRTVIRGADPDFAIDVIGTGRSVMAGPFVFLSRAGLAAIGLGGLTLLLAMAGLFGIQSHIVEHRTHEVGVRMSLGATAAKIQWMILKDGARPVIGGLAVGFFIIGIAGRAIVRRYLDVGIGLADIWLVLFVPATLAIAAVAACYIPARRASRVDPNVALRHL